jgi:ubiquinone/menaquinone biosynthesis C-methylase UbiE
MKKADANKILSDSSFTDDLAPFYESTLVPLIFESYAEDLASRAKKLNPDSVLEVACGTGVVTRALSTVLPDHCSITSTDLNDAMINHAEKIGTCREVIWEQADVMALPYDDETFDVVVCQFSTMFFPDRILAYQEICRVLKSGGKFLFSIWNGLEVNDFARAVMDAVTDLFPENPPEFLSRTPYGHGNPDEIKDEIYAAGFDRCHFIQQEDISYAENPTMAAIAFCQGTPLRNEIEDREPDGLERVTAIAANSIRSRFGDDQIQGRMSAVIVTAE